MADATRRLADVGPSIAREEGAALPKPMLPIACGMIGGIVLDYYFAPSARVLYAALFGGCLVALFSKRSRIGVVALILSAAGLGALRHDLAFRRLPDQHIYQWSREEPILVHLSGETLVAPEIVEPDPSVPRAFEAGPRTRFIIEAKSVAGETGPISVCGKVSCVVKAPLLSLRVGDSVEMTGWLYRPRPPANPGQYDWHLASRRAGIWACFACEHAESVHAARPASSGLRGVLVAARTRLRGFLIHRAFQDDDDRAGVIEAMVLGQRDAVSKAMNDAFVRTGNAHFLAASGMNVGWLALMGWTVMRLLGAYYRVTALFIAAFIVSFVLFAEDEPSILRAGVVGLLGCLAVWIRGRPNIVNWLACSAVVILLVDPCDLFRPGFQLSFLGVIAIMHLGPIIDRALRLWLGRFAEWIGAGQWAIRYALTSDEAMMLTQPDESLHGIIRRRIGRGTVLAFSATFAAWLMAAPLTCFVFGQISPWGIVGTLALWPAAFAATLVGYAKVMLGLVFPSSSAVMGPALGATTSIMVVLVDVLAKLPGNLIDGRAPSPAWVLSAYAVIAWRMYRPERFAFRYRFPLLTISLVAWWWVGPRLTMTGQAEPRLWVLAVGDGSANVIELPDGRTMVCDFGTRSPFDAGRIAVAFLRSRGIQRIDAVFVSHADFDHFSGVETLAREFDVGRVILNDQFEPYLREKSAAWYFLKIIRDQGVPVEFTHGATRFGDFGGVVIESIWPPPHADGPIGADNDRSTVLRLTYAGRRVLLPGDISEAAMSRLLDQGDLKADVLVLPHHGSVVKNTKRFIDAVNPSICIRSSGQQRRITMNGIEVLVQGRTYFSTADVGCVRVSLGSDGPHAVAPMNRP